MGELNPNKPWPHPTSSEIRPFSLELLKTILNMCFQWYYEAFKSLRSLVMVRDKFGKFWASTSMILSHKNVISNLINVCNAKLLCVLIFAWWNGVVRSYWTIGLAWNWLGEYWNAIWPYLEHIGLRYMVIVYYLIKMFWFYILHDWWSFIVMGSKCLRLNIEMFCVYYWVTGYLNLTV